MIKTLKNHPQYDATIADVIQVRDCIEGSQKIKREGLKYLKHPDMIDQTSKVARNRYRAYIDGAEFDDYPADTARAMLGAMTKGAIEVDLPDAIDYLIENIDGDGMPLSGLQELCYKNLLEAKFHILVAEFGSVASLGIDAATMSKADYDALGIRASIKSYSREALVDWEFERVNGVMQMSLLVFEEIETHRNKDTLAVESVKSRLILGLDNDGNYYQKKLTQGKNGSYVDSAPVYPLVAGSQLKWLPVEIVADEELQSGELPSGTGYLRAICDATLYRYRMSADEKEAIRHMQPTLFPQGWKQGDLELFKEINGRDYIAMGSGSSNCLPAGVTVEVVGLGAQVEPFEKYYERNDKKLASFGANVGGDTQHVKTATQASSEASKRVAVMHSITNNTERAISRLVSYCGMCRGLWGADDVESALKSIVIKFPREFAREKMAADEVNAIISLVSSAIYSRAEAVRMLVAGGFSVSDAETILAEVDEQGPQPLMGSEPAI